jgi:hypothetical protein
VPKHKPSPRHAPVPEQATIVIGGVTLSGLGGAPGLDALRSSIALALGIDASRVTIVDIVAGVASGAGRRMLRFSEDAASSSSVSRRDARHLAAGDAVSPTVQARPFV